MNTTSSEQLSGIAGYCLDCDEVHSLPSAKAAVHCKMLFERLKSTARLDFEFPEITADPELSTAFLYSEMGGKMFGVLVCEDKQGKEVVLKAFSGKFNNRRMVKSWAPHLFDEPAFNAVIAEGNSGIHPLTAYIAALEKGSDQWKKATEERRQISLGVLGKLYALYSVHNFRSEARSLSGAFRFHKGIPMGTGDCCAPKLLNYAAVNGLKPVSLAEFFLGKSSGSCVEGVFYPPCEDKCAPLLGFMLCGADI